MKFCTQCGSQLTDDAKFCTGCGTPCASVVPQITPTTQAPHKKGMAWDHLQKYGYLRKRISTGGVHVAAMQADGSVKAIGSNKSGQCDVFGWTNLQMVECSSFATFGLTTDGRVLCAGEMPFPQQVCADNIYGIPVSEWQRNIKDISTDLYFVGGHILGLTEGGRVVSYGANVNGCCEVEAWTDVVEIKALPKLSLGVRRDGTVLVTGDSAVAKQVSSWCNIEHIYGNEGELQYVIGLKYDGTVVCASESVPLRTSHWQDIIDISCGNKFIAGLTGDGKVYFAGNAAPDLLQNGLENVLMIQLQGEAVCAHRAQGGIWFGSLDSMHTWKLLEYVTAVYSIGRSGAENMVSIRPDGDVQIIGNAASPEEDLAWQLFYPATPKPQSNSVARGSTYNSNDSRQKELEKKKNKNLVWAIVFLLFCWPVSIYFFYQYNKYDKALAALSAQGANAPSVPVQQNMCKEYRMRCNVCGKVYCYSDEDLKRNKQARTGAILSSGMALVEGLDGSRLGSISMNSYNATADRFASQITDYTKCPQCNSKDVTIIGEEEYVL